MSAPSHIVIDTASAGLTLASVLRRRLLDHSWKQIRQIVASRRVKLNKELCLDPARRLSANDTVEILSSAATKPRDADAIVIRHLDAHLVVVEKPSGIATTRHPSERSWSERRKSLHPTLEDVVPKLISRTEKKKRKGPPPRLRIVHRLDKETSGLLVMARTVAAERGLGKQFHAHTVLRRYIAIVPGAVKPQTISTRLVRDRGDRRRGSTTQPATGKQAITHIEAVQELKGFSLLTCRLETGRTHQIRIHLAELGHPVCGERVYHRDVQGNLRTDPSGLTRLALHAAELGLVHPVTGETHYWEMPLPEDLAKFVRQHAKP